MVLVLTEVSRFWISATIVGETVFTVELAAGWSELMVGR